MFIKEEVQATCCTLARSGNCDKREYLALELTEHRPGSVLQEDAGQKVQQIQEEIVFPAPTFTEYACYGQFLQVLMVIADCDYSIWVLGQEFKINTISFNLLVLVFRTEHPGTIRTMFWGQPGPTICHLRLLLLTCMLPHWSGSRHFTAVSVCTFRKHPAKRNLVPLPRRHWDEVVLDTQQTTTMGCPQPTFLRLTTPLFMLFAVRCSSWHPWVMTALSCMLLLCSHTCVVSRAGGGAEASYANS